MNTTDYEKRLQFLTETGRRCHGNNGKCTHAAVREATVYPVSANGERIGENVTLKMCGKASHCAAYLSSSAYAVVECKDISQYSGRASAPGQRRQFDRTPPAARRAPSPPALTFQPPA